MAGPFFDSASDGPDDAQLHALFASHAPEKGHYSTCMHFPPWAGTRSLTVTRLTAEGALMSYVPGPPCTTSMSPAAELGWATP